MVKKDLHSRFWCFRRFSGFLLVAIYSVIVLAPLSSLAMNSKTVTHAVTGECSGDCNVCGCSLESRTSNTCCCAKKRELLQNKLNSEKKNCCPIKSEVVKPAGPAPQKPSCCPTANPAKTEVKKEEASRNVENKSDIVFKCGCPCGKSKLPVVAGVGSFELLPYFYTEAIKSPADDLNMSFLTHFMASRHVEPPDPPPKISFLPEFTLNN